MPRSLELLGGYRCEMPLGDAAGLNEGLVKMHKIDATAQASIAPCGRFPARAAPQGMTVK